MEDNDTERFEFYTRLMALNNTLQVRIRNHYETYMNGFRQRE